MKSPTITTVEEWLEKILNFVAMAKFIVLIREKTITSLFTDWKPLIDFSHENDNDVLMTCGFCE